MNLRILKTSEEARIKFPISSHSFTLLKCSKWGVDKGNGSRGDGVAEIS
jgi:hypothetical protein